MLYNCYHTSDVRYPFLLNWALLFLIVVKMTIECERDQYTIETRENQRLRSEGDNDGRLKRCYSNAVLRTSFT